tara:strand:- start:1856 stop:2092 length:237 start_codon:yes stop_codon:yes gene_type:complete
MRKYATYDELLAARRKRLSKNQVLKMLAHDRIAETVKNSWATRKTDAQWADEFGVLPLSVSRARKGITWQTLYREYRA